MNKAFVFDLNGTLINDMQYHITAWHDVLNNLGAGIDMERMKAECYGKGEELIERIMPGKFTHQERISISEEKESVYRIAYQPHLHLITGANEFLQEAFEKGILMAIGSAAPRLNVDFVLDGMNIRHFFKAVISADEVQHSKPDPETYLLCAKALHLPAKDCIVFEDALMGVKSAYNAGMKCVVLTTVHAEHEFEEDKNIIAFGNNFTVFSITALQNQI